MKTLILALSLISLGCMRATTQSQGRDSDDLRHAETIFQGSCMIRSNTRTCKVDLPADVSSRLELDSEITVTTGPNTDLEPVLYSTFRSVSTVQSDNGNGKRVLRIVGHGAKSIQIFRQRPGRRSLLVNFKIETGAESTPDRVKVLAEFDMKTTALALFGEDLLVGAGTKLYLVSRSGEKQELAEFNEQIQAVVGMDDHQKIAVSLRATTSRVLRELPIKIGSWSAAENTYVWQSRGIEFKIGEYQGAPYYLWPKGFYSHGQKIYAITSGAMVAVSSDFGASWSSLFAGERINQQQGCYPGLIAIPNANPQQLYQGMECPLDFAHVREYYRGQGPVARDSGQLVFDQTEIANRRINSMTQHPLEDHILLVGHEGALTRIDTTDNSWEFLYEGGAERPGHPSYVYVKSVYVDRSNPDRMILSGTIQRPGDNFHVLETVNGGETWQHISKPEEIQIPVLSDHAVAGADGLYILAQAKEEQGGYLMRVD